LGDKSEWQLFLQIFWDALIFFTAFFAWKFKMAPKFKMDAKMFLSFKTCKFNYFIIFLQDCLNWANRSCFQNTVFYKNSKWPKNSIWQIFCTKIHDFLVGWMKYSNFCICHTTCTVLLLKNCCQHWKIKMVSKSRWRRKCLYFSIFKLKNPKFFWFWVLKKKLENRKIGLTQT
jgi:hypothetical protein